MEEFKVLRYSKKEWESDFFGTKFYKIFLQEELEKRKLNEELERFVREVDFDLVECNLDVSRISSAKILQQNGFKLIDSRAAFKTLINSADKAFDYPNEFPKYKIRNYLPKDNEKIQSLTLRNFTHNNNFTSRYKDCEFFKQGDSERYFEAWVNYSIGREDTHISVATYDDEVVGFLIFEKTGLYKDFPIYKGILCAVETPHRGTKLHLSMQTFLFKQFEHKEFYLDNTTQLSNYAVLKNYIRANRKLDEMALTFLLKK